VAYMLAEVAVTVSMFLIGRKYIPISFLKKEHLHYVMGSVVMGCVLYFIKMLGLSHVLTFVVMLVSGMTAYLMVLFYKKDSIGLMLWTMIISKLR